MLDLNKEQDFEEKQFPLTSLEKESPPPSYSADPPVITAALSNLSLDRGTAKPTRDQCIAHLKLLECFHELRQTIATDDGLFGIRDDFAEQVFAPNAKAELLLKIREKRWAIYVAKAAKRFEAWWQHAIEVSSEMQSLHDLPRVPASIKSALPFNDMENHLPPIGESTSSYKV